MTAEQAEVLKLARQTFEMVCNIEKQLASLTVKMAARQSSGDVAGDVAGDRDLDGPHGDPVVRKDPKRWSGSSFAGYKFSECPPEYLDVLAEFKEWQAGMDARKGTPEDDRKAKFNRLDAARARGWAARKRDGWAPAEAPEREPGSDDTDDVIF